MTSALSPRDIQARIRSGESLEDVAREAGVPAEKVEPYAAPVLAEREHVAGSALQCPVRRRGETGSVRAMRAVIAERLAPQGREVDDLTWDAWRNEDRRWSVAGRWEADGEQHEALFTFDHRARFSVAANDDARRLIGEHTAAPAPATVPVESPDAEPTIDLNDELAIVRAVQGSVPIVEQPTPRQAPSPVVQQRPAAERVVEAETPAAAPQAAEPAATGQEDLLDASEDELEVDDYSPAELEEVDGLYDIVPGNASDMDVLYEMLSSFSEDSVNIYAGLTAPVVPEAGGPVEPLRSAEEYDAEQGDQDAALRTDEPGLGEEDLVPDPGTAPGTDTSAGPAQGIGADEQGLSAQRSHGDGEQVSQEQHVEHAALAALETPAASATEDAVPATPVTDGPEVAGHPGELAADQAQQVVQPGSEAEEASEPTVAIHHEPAGDERAQHVVQPGAEEPEALEAADPAEPVLSAVEDAEPEQVAEPVEEPEARREPNAAGAGDPAPVPQQPAAEAPSALSTVEDAQPAVDEVAERDIVVDVVPTEHVELVETPAVDVEAISEPEQAALVEAEPAPAQAPRTRARSSRKKRASVPSWDEIMFGGPTPGKG